MARNYYINGQCLVSYNGSELGLTDNQGKVTIIPNPSYLPIEVDGWFSNPPERQVTLMSATIRMTLVHFDIDVFNSAMKFSTQGSVEGTLPIGGVLLGANNGLKTLSLSSPTAARPWVFPTVYIKDHYNLPLGAERSLLEVEWHAIGYRADPYNGNGTSAEGVVVYTNT